MAKPPKVSPSAHASSEKEETHASLPSSQPVIDVTAEEIVAGLIRQLDVVLDSPARCRHTAVAREHLWQALDALKSRASAG